MYMYFMLQNSGDYLRLWTIDDQEPGGVKLQSLLNNVSETPSPPYAITPIVL